MISTLTEPKKMFTFCHIHNEDLDMQGYILNQDIICMKSTVSHKATLKEIINHNGIC